MNDILKDNVTALSGPDSLALLSALKETLGEQTEDSESP